MNKIIAIFIVTLFFRAGLCQASSDYEIQYDPVGNNLFPGYDNAKLVVDYFYTEGISNSERYSYEIIVVDNMLMLSFRSPETEDYYKINFKTKRTLTKKQTASLSSVLRRSRMKQIKDGMPRPYCSGNTREVLIIRSKELNIAGGLFYCGLFDSDDTKESIQKQIQSEEKETSSIGGNYRAVFDLLDSFFIEKKGLLKKVYRTQ